MLATEVCRLPADSLALPPLPLPHPPLFMQMERFVKLENRESIRTRNDDRAK